MELSITSAIADAALLQVEEGCVTVLRRSCLNASSVTSAAAIGACMIESDLAN